MEVIKNVCDFEERTFLFAKNTRLFVKKLENNIWNKEDIKPLVPSSGAGAANDIEANKKLGEKDFLMKLIIFKKQAKETLLWLR